MKRSIFRTCLVFLATLIGTTQLAGCSGEVSFTTASLSEATMATGTDSDSQPVGATDQFEVDTPEIFCSVKLSNAPNDTEVLSEWVYVKGELEGVTDHVIDTVPVVTDGTRYLELSMERPDSGWPRGDYKLVLYVDGKEEVAVPFTVESTSGATSAAPISQVTMALGADDEGQPINPTSTFPAGTTKVYTTLYVAEDVATGTPLRAEWYQMQGESPIFIDSYDFEVEGGYNRYFYYEVLDGWPQGEYAIVISLDGKEQAIVQYSVS